MPRLLLRPTSCCSPCWDACYSMNPRCAEPHYKVHTKHWANLNYDVNELPFNSVHHIACLAMQSMWCTELNCISFTSWFRSAQCLVCTLQWGAAHLGFIEQQSSQQGMQKDWASTTVETFDCRIFFFFLPQNTTSAQKAAALKNKRKITWRQCISVLEMTILRNTVE